MEDLKRISNITEIKDILSEAFKRKFEVFVWNLDGDNQIMDKYYLYSFNRELNQILFKKIDEEKPKINLTINGVNNFYIAELSVLFQMNLKEMTADQTLRYDFPHIVVRAERRKHLRLKLNNLDDSYIEFTISNKMTSNKSLSFKKDLFDLSAGGVSFYLAKSEMSFFKVGDRIMHSSLYLAGQKFKVDLELVNIKHMSPNSRNNVLYDSNRACLKFSKIDKIVKNFINEYVICRYEIKTAS